MALEAHHNYEYSVDAEAQTAPAKVVRMVGENKKVLEIELLLNPERYPYSSLQICLENLPL